MKKLSWLTEHGHPVLLDRLQEGIFAIEEGRVIYVNQRLADMLGYPADQLIGRPFIEMVASEDRLLVLERHHARLAGEEVPENYDMRLCARQGKEILCSLNVGLGENRIGSTVTVGSIRDVTQQRAALIELEASKTELKAIFDKLPDIIFRTDMQGIITKVSPSCFEITGYRPEEMSGTPLSAYYYGQEVSEDLRQTVIDSGGKSTLIEASFRHKNGTVIWFSSNVSVRYKPDGSPDYIEGVARNISERKRIEEELIVLSRTDGQTGAYNRRYFMERSEEVIALTKRYQRAASLMVADLDHFKAINDNFGHHAGDLALNAFAEVCQQEIRESDIFGRLGGEEFGLMLPETSILHAQNLAERILKASAALEIKLDNHTIRITVSIGLVEIRADDTSVGALLRRADLAMYKAKSQGRNQVVASIT